MAHIEGKNSAKLSVPTWACNFRQLKGEIAFKIAVILVLCFLLIELPVYNIHGDFGGHSHGHPIGKVFIFTNLSIMINSSITLGVVGKRMRQAICIFMLLPCLTAYGQQGYIDYDQVVKTLPGYLAAKDTIEVKTRQWRDSIELKVKAFQDFLQNALPHNRRLDPAEAAALEDTIKAMEVNIQHFQTLAQREIKKVEEILDARLKEYVSMKLQRFCTIKGILCVVDMDSILYCSGCVDYTEDFLDYLAKNK